METWRDLEGYEGMYQVSDQGRVKSLDRIIKIEKKGKKVEQRLMGKVLSPYDNRKGYLLIDLSKNGKRQREYIHRLVAKAFINNPNELPQVNHLNNVRNNNFVNNLEWTSAQGNVDHMVKQDRHHSKLRPDQILEIRKLIDKGVKQKDIAIKYQVAPTIISNINTGRAWWYVS